MAESQQILDGPRQDHAFIDDELLQWSELSEEEKARQAALAARPPLENMLNMHDFEVIAKAVIPEKAWVCTCGLSEQALAHVLSRHTTLPHPTTRSPSGRTELHSSGTGEAQYLCLRSPLIKLCRVWFRPRILRDVSTVDWSTTILGQKSSLPVYIVSSVQSMVASAGI